MHPFVLTCSLIKRYGKAIDKHVGGSAYFSLQGYATVQSSQVQIQNVDALNLSPKLQAYVRKVERQTHRKVVFERRTSSGPVEFPAWFEADRSHVWIVISPSLDLTSPDAMISREAEWVIAHEMTHGVLYYARGISS